MLPNKKLFIIGAIFTIGTLSTLALMKRSAIAEKPLQTTQEQPASEPVSQIVEPVQQEPVKASKPAPAGIIHIKTQEQFDEILANGTPVMAKCSAEWCQPCQMMKPIYKKIANEYKGTVTFIEFADEVFMPKSLGIKGLPTFIGFKNGKEIYRFYGPVDIKEVREKVDQLLK